MPLGDRTLYKQRNRIERMFGHLKINRAIATRYDQLANSFLGMVHIATARYWLKFVHAAWCLRNACWLVFRETIAMSGPLRFASSIASHCQAFRSRLTMSYFSIYPLRVFSRISLLASRPARASSS